MQWSKEDIVSYYKRNEFGYSLYGRNMHYGFWDSSTKTLRQATEKFNEVLTHTAHITNKDLVLDAGCGVGGASTYLAKTIGCHVTGITICPRQIPVAYANAKKDGVAHLAEFYEMDYEKTAFKKGSFDVVWGLESICYAKNKGDFIREAFRLLKKGGRLIVADGFASKPDYAGRERIMMDKWLNGWFVNYLETPEGFARLAKETGFNTTSYRNVTDSVIRTSRIMYYVSWFFFIFHFIDKIVPLKGYPTDAIFHQYHAMKKRLWEYGIFYAEK